MKSKMPSQNSSSNGGSSRCKVPICFPPVAVAMVDDWTRVQCLMKVCKELQAAARLISNRDMSLRDEDEAACPLVGGDASYLVKGYTTEIHLGSLCTNTA
ncbi:unnamed protein product [Natator depressus]